MVRAANESNLADVLNNVINCLCVSLSAVPFGNKKQYVLKHSLETLLNLLIGYSFVLFDVLLLNLRVHVDPAEVLENLEDAPVDETRLLFKGFKQIFVHFLKAISVRSIVPSIKKLFIEV